MFRAMRRKKQAPSHATIKDILRRGTSGVLALSGDDDYPYAVRLSYVYDNGKLYFHCAKSGQKIDAVRGAHRKEAINLEWEPLCMLEMSIEHITGREAIELTVKKSSMHM